MHPLDSARGSAGDPTSDYGRDSLACGGGWKTISSASRCNSLLFSSRILHFCHYEPHREDLHGGL